MSLTILCVVFLLSFDLVSSDYQCVCSHHTQRGIYGSPSLKSPPLGFLYKDECKALVAIPNLDKQWTAVQFFHMIAYIETDSEINVVLCPGTIPDEDKVFITCKASTMNPPTTSLQAQTSKSTPQQSVTTGHLSSSQSHPTSNSSKTVQITSTKSAISQQTYSPTTAAPTTLTTRKTTKHQQHHVSIKPTFAPFSTGRLQLCPNNVQLGAHVNGFKLGQHHHSCYELCNHAVSWFHANDICKSRGGHLASVTNADENHYVHMLIKQYYHNKVFWIGLNDLQHEEQFTWSSGEYCNYKHWKTGRKSLQHSQEDCVVMIYNGHWDDRTCGSTTFFTEYLYTRYPFVCEYGIQGESVLIG